MLQITCSCDLKHKLSVWTRYAFKMEGTGYGFMDATNVKRTQ